MKDQFKNKVVIVTGASSGIGESIAREFAKSGSKVIMAARTEAKLAVIVDEINATNGEASYIVTDVSIDSDCRQLIEKTIEKHGRIDFLVNNAGVSMRALFTEVDLRVLHHLMDVNFWGTVYCTKYALPYILEQKGSLIGISSVAGFHGLPGRTGYSASKFAMHGFLETIRIENLKKGLHVMIIAPGFTESEVRKNALTGDGSPQGESPRNEKNLMSSESVAKWVLKGIRKKKRNKLISWEGKLTALFQRIVPGFVDWVYYHEMSKEPKSPLK
jgi:short-subunit dehydrogenase